MKNRSRPVLPRSVLAASAFALAVIAQTAPAQVAPYLPDDAQVARTRALARSMTVAPTQGRRDQGEIMRTTGIKQPCSMNIASNPAPTAGSGRAYGPQNTVVVVTASPIVNCGL